MNAKHTFAWDWAALDAVDNSACPIGAKRLRPKLPQKNELDPGSKFQGET